MERKMTHSLVLTVAVSVGVHVLLAVGLVACLEYAPAPDVVATLDLTSVELSFAEKVEESAAFVPVPPSPPSEAPKPKAEETPPEQKIEKLDAPDPLAPKFPEPKDERPQMQEPEPVVREPSRDPAPPEKLTQSNTPNTPDNSNNQTISAPAAPRQARVDAPPSPKRAIRPDYPKGARQRGEQGEVTLAIQVDAEGAVSEAKVVVSSGFAELDEAAVRAVQKAKFRPARSDGKSVASTARLKLAFRLK